MARLACLLLAACLAGCARHAPPAPVVQCRSGDRSVVIDGVYQRGIATWCRDGSGVALHD